MRVGAAYGIETYDYYHCGTREFAERRGGSITAFVRRGQFRNAFGRTNSSNDLRRHVAERLGRVRVGVDPRGDIQHWRRRHSELPRSTRRLERIIRQIFWGER
jgi:hypothetical protein